jgi:hypothetical protein
MSYNLIFKELIYALQLFLRAEQTCSQTVIETIFMEWISMNILYKK